MIQKTEQFSKTYILEQMIKLFQKEGSWTQNALARDANGNGVVPESREAVSFDIIGALYSIEHKNHSPSQIRIGQEVREALRGALNSVTKKSSISEIIHKDNFAFHLNKYNDAFGRSRLEIIRLIEKAKEY